MVLNEKRDGGGSSNFSRDYDNEYEKSPLRLFANKIENERESVA
jgi:hypothetical protein